MKRNLLLTLFTSLFIILTACSSGDGLQIETTMSSNVGSFEAITHEEEAFTEDDFLGSWSVVSFIFTNCTTTCPPMTNNMSSLQDKLVDEGIENVELVTFSVDPDYDTPDVLEEYGEMFGADFSNWTFLTGYDFDVVKELSIKSFKVMLQSPMPGDDQVAHSVMFFLVTPDGEIVKRYNGDKAAEMDDIVDDLKVVTK